jgi:cyclopropane fatty-acyl-phospholipid synthase-like methyltransferase
MILDLNDQAWGNDYISIEKNIESKLYPLRFCICKDCMMAQIDHTVPKEKMFINHSYVSGTTKSLKNHFVNIGRSILSQTSLGRDDYILDLGGNDGTFLEFFKDNECNVLNVDSGVVQSKISNKKGIECINDFFSNRLALEIIKKQGKAKIIHGSGIFFHLEELHDFFKGVETLLSDDGILVAEFIYLPDLIKNCAYDQIYHEHLLYYTLSTLQNLLDRFNLEIYDATLKDIHGGSCIAYISHKKNHKEHTIQLCNLLKKEKKNRMNSMETYYEFSKRASKNKNKLIKMISHAKSQNKKIHALGAPVKGSTIINYCGFTNDDIECGVEINKHKFNTFFPGTRIPVYDQEATPNPDVYLLLSWNFQNEILAKLSDYRDKGGEIIVPIPNPELI